MIDEDPRIDPADLRGVRFPGSRRRYEAPAVDQFVQSLIDRVTRTNALVDDLLRRAELAEATADASPSTSPFDEPDLSSLSDDELVNLVGAETTRVLTTARHAADDIRTKAEESAARVIREATTEAQTTTAAAEERAAALLAEATAAHDTALAEAQAAAEELRARTAEEIDGLLEGARADAETVRAEADATRTEAAADAERIREEARDEGRAMVNEAKAVRARVLDDLQRRRDLARTQIQTLLAGRARLVAAYERVRADLDLATAELEAAGPALDDAEAEAAADELVASLDAEDAAEADEADIADVDADVDADADADAEVGPPGSDASETDTGVADDRVAAPASDGDEPAPADALDEAEAAGATSDEEPAAEPDSADDGVAEPTATDAPETGEQTTDTPAPTAVAEVDEADEADLEAAVDAGDGPTEPVDHAADGDEEAEPDVDALFARIRAERAESVARAQRVLSGTAEPAPTAPEPTAAPGPAVEPAADDPRTPDEVPPASAAADAVADAAREAMAEADPDERDDAVETADVDAVPAELLAPALEHQRRQEALDPLDAQLSRALKRHLADEQNEVLDALRRSQSTDTADLLPAAAAHTASYAAVAIPLLEAAARAGADADDAPVEVADLSETLAASLIEPFRRRIERAAADVDGDPDALDERLRAVYREWKVSHIGTATTDVLLSAYAQGQLAGAPDGASVRWRIDPAQGPCPDAQDNALSGAIAVGDTFPTGDTCPQAHPGCRCLLVVTP